jgi:hypothetical protein
VPLRVSFFSLYSPLLALVPTPSSPFSGAGLGAAPAITLLDPGSKLVCAIDLTGTDSRRTSVDVSIPGDGTTCTSTRTYTLLLISRHQRGANSEMWLTFWQITACNGALLNNKSKLYVRTASLDRSSGRVIRASHSVAIWFRHLQPLVSPRGCIFVFAVSEY